MGEEMHRRSTETITETGPRCAGFQGDLNNIVDELRLAHEEVQHGEVYDIDELFALYEARYDF